MRSCEGFIGKYYILYYLKIKYEYMLCVCVYVCKCASEEEKEIVRERKRELPSLSQEFIFTLLAETRD